MAAETAENAVNTVNSLLGRCVALGMGLVQRVYEVSSNEPEFSLLKSQPMTAVLQETAWPYAVNTARGGPFPLLGAVIRWIRHWKGCGELQSWKTSLSTAETREGMTTASDLYGATL